jgi:hypothetical protein
MCYLVNWGRAGSNGFQSILGGGFEGKIPSKKLVGIPFFFLPKNFFDAL